MTRPTPLPPQQRRAPERSTKYYVGLLISIVLLFEVAPLEYSMVYPSLRYMAAEFNTPDIGWVVTILGLVGVVSLPIIGKLGDIYGKKRMLMVVAGIFSIGTLTCALAPTFPILLLGRALEAASVGMTPLAYGLIRDVFPRRMIPVALSAVSTGIGFNGIAGPLIGGYLSTEFGYRAIFWFLLAYVAVIAPAVYFTAPESPLRLSHQLDWVGAGLLGGGSLLLMLSINQGRSWGWDSPKTLIAFAVSAVLSAVFVLYELHTTQPLIDMRVLWARAMRSTMLASLLGSFAIGGYAFALPLMLMTPRVDGISYGFGLTAFAFALWTLPHGILAMASGPLAGLLARSSGPRASLIVAMTAIMISLSLLAFVHDQQWQIITLVAIFGVGQGFFYAASANLVVEAVPPSQTGANAGVLGSSNSLGAAFGVTILSAILSAHIWSVDQGTRQIIYTDAGFTYVFLLLGALGAIGLIVAFTMSHGRAPASGGATIGANTARPAAATIPVKQQSPTEATSDYHA